MPEWFEIFWDEEEDGNVEHLAEHGVIRQEAEHVLRTTFDDRQRSRSTPEYWLTQGYTVHGRYLIVVFELHEDLSLVIPVTAYEPTESL